MLCRSAAMSLRLGAAKAARRCLLASSTSTSSSSSSTSTSFSTASPPFLEGCVANDAAAFLQSRLPSPGWKPQLGLVLGSGMGKVAEAIEAEAVVGFEEVPDFPVSTVHGHAGKLIFGQLNGVRVACQQGRVHLYEGVSPRTLRVPIYALKLLGCEQYLVTTAVGSLMPGGVGPGDLVSVSDHINLQGQNPLTGSNDPIGPRFVDMSNAYDPHIREMLKEAAMHQDVQLYEGVYAALPGPAFETPAEIRMLRVLGADVVGMSLVSEVTAARHAGLQCAAVSVVVNYASAYNSGEITHDETLHFSNQAADKMTRLIGQYCTARSKLKENFWKTI